MNPICEKIFENIRRVMRGQDSSIRKLIAALAAGGHVLLEDFPGTGKTTLAKTLAKSIGSDFKRIQFTPDLLPSDIIGVSIFNQKDNAFHFHKGPVFTNILLADEINRASPRTQSALLEAMAESQVSADGKRHNLDELFFVIATQNPIESAGTYPLPEAQMDRFSLKFKLGYVPSDQEVRLLSDQSREHPIKNIHACVTAQEALHLKHQVSDIHISEELKGYIVEIVRATRSAAGVNLGASPRASLALMKIAKALALFDGMEFVIPDHIREIATPVIAHRLLMDTQAKFSGLTAEKVVEDILNTLPVPV